MRKLWIFPRKWRRLSLIEQFFWKILRHPLVSAHLSPNNYLFSLQDNKIWFIDQKTIVWFFFFKFTILLGQARHLYESWPLQYCTTISFWEKYIINNKLSALIVIIIIILVNCDWLRQTAKFAGWALDGWLIISQRYLLLWCNLIRLIIRTYHLFKR